jgi:5-formyltetrahydrofolate cyclo-ligase
MTDKSELRRSLLQQRRSLPVQQWQEKSDRICSHLQAWEPFQQAQTILSYASTRQEPDLSPLLSSEQRWGLPRCVAQSLYWHQWQLGQRTIAGVFNIPEPHPAWPMIPLEEVDLILIPAIACDHLGYRLGYGGGFYDRMLSAIDRSTLLTVGITFAFAHLPRLPTDPWDQPLDAVCTEVGLFLI